MSFISCLAPAILFLFLLAPDCGHAASPASESMLVYVGTFTDTPAKSKGIYCFRLTMAPAGDMELAPLGVAAETLNPSFLAIDPARRLLFCVNEVDSFNGNSGGAVSAFTIDSATGKLHLINQQPSLGSRPCYLAMDKTGKNLLVANYNTGNFAVLPIAPDGHLGTATSFFQDAGNGPDPQRQEGPHAHCGIFSPDNRFAYVCDLGIDKVMIFKFEAVSGKLTPNDPAFAKAAPGAGPRHLVFHPTGKFAYLISEMGSTVSAFACDTHTGGLKELQTLSTLPADFSGVNKGAEIAISPSGKYLFASNRGRNTIAVFAVDPDKGTLQRLNEQSTEGKTPRFFGLLPAGNGMVICNQDSNTILTCKVDPRTGQTMPSPNLIHVPAPVCAAFLPLR